jgi:molybdenum cofactor biosynthesis protein A
MPEEGIHYLPKRELLTFEEIDRLISIVASMGISKIRLTGGEPFVRNDLMALIRRIVEIPGVNDLHITTNGVLTAPHIPALKKLGIASVNLSLDTLDKERFLAITRRDTYKKVMHTFHALLDHEIPVKLNAVVMDGKNIDDIIPLIELTKKYDLSVRFIEEMPFNGEGNHYPTLVWSYGKILEYITAHYPDLLKIQDPVNSTSYNYAVPGYVGSIGIIAAFSRSFCGTCNRIRVTAQGGLKTCLYDDGVLNIKALMRNGNSDDAIKVALIKAFGNRPLDGFEAEVKRNDKLPVHESMSTIGG